MSEVMAFAFPVPSAPAVTTVDQSLFPVRRIYCVGRNYAAHVREMGHDPEREEPFFFMKPADAVVPSGSTIPYPSMTADLHHEIEMVVAIGKGGRDIPTSRARDHIFGYAVGIDLTRRDLQGHSKKHGRPWEMGKSFDNSAPCGPISSISQVGHIDMGEIWLKVNGEIRQHSDVKMLIWSVPEMIAHLSRFVELQAGDLLYTGTPEGVSACRKGDTLVGHVDGLEEIVVKIS
jgi:fumarylpyruvate hydrolase